MNVAARPLADQASLLAEVGSPRLTALSTAVPRNVVTQDRARDYVRDYLASRTDIFEYLAPVFTNAKIDTRYSCQPFDWYLTERSFAEKTEAYADSALALALEVTNNSLAQARLRADEIDAIVCVSSTGVMTPSLDARLMNLLPFRRDTIRLPVFGLGCAGGVLGMTRAAQLSRSRPGMKVLLVVVELCSLAIRHDRWVPSNVVATALFGDGAAGAIIENIADGEGDPGRILGTLGAGGEHTWQDTLDIMGWAIDGNGFDVIFQRSIPSVITEDYPGALYGFLDRNGLTMADFDRMCCHPGGIKVIEALEDVCGAGRGGLEAEREVLRNYGNMSAPTVLFVLDHLVKSRAEGRMLMSSLGPGFCAAFQSVGLTPHS
jgi:alkylresorcinol/alkylpyrone synthase